MKEIKVNVHCPVCGSHTGTVELEKLVVSWIKNNRKECIKQVWHQSCFIGDNQIDNIADKTNNFLFSVEDFGEVVKEFCQKRGKNKSIEYDRLLEKYDDLKVEMDKLRDEVIKWL